MGWIKDKDNPIIQPVPGTWKEIDTTNPDLLLIENRYFLYYRGQGGDGHDRIGVMTIPKDKFNGKTWDDYSGNPIIDIGKPGSFDCRHVLDPGAVYVDGIVYLYYTAWDNDNPPYIGLATSTDGYKFSKHLSNPILKRCGGPEIVHKDGIFYLFYATDETIWDSGGLSIFLTTSEDGYNFSRSTCVLRPGKKDNWDSYSMSTPRIFSEDGIYYMVYAGSNIYRDYFYDFGVAVSKDLYNWEKYSGNPVFSRGEKGTWDEGAIWFGTVERVKDNYYMWYGGYGGGKSREKEYGEGASEQIGLARLKYMRNFIDSLQDKNGRQKIMAKLRR